MGERAKFEAWAALLPREWESDRYGKDEYWTGQYRHYPMQCAWESWCESRRLDESRQDLDEFRRFVDESRQRFESKYSDGVHDCLSIRRDESGEYTLMQTRMAWLAWCDAVSEIKDILEG